MTTNRELNSIFERRFHQKADCVGSATNHEVPYEVVTFVGGSNYGDDIQCLIDNDSRNWYWASARTDGVNRVVLEVEAVSRNEIIEFLPPGSSSTSPATPIHSFRTKLKLDPIFNKDIVPAPDMVLCRISKLRKNHIRRFDILETKAKAVGIRKITGAREITITIHF